MIDPIELVEKYFLRILFMLLALIVVVALLLATTNSNAGEFYIEFIDVGQGDATLIRSPEGLYGLIDTGRLGSVESRLAYILPHRNLEFLMITHPDADHMEATLNLLETYNIKYIFWQKHSNNKPLFAEFQDKVNSQSNLVSVQPLAKNDFRLGCCVDFDILWPSSVEEVYNLPPNEASYALRISYLEKSFWLGGDLSKEYEDAIVRVQPNSSREAWVLKAGHHGSSTSTSQLLINSLRPDYAIISAGLNNSYGHPHSEVIELLTANNINVLQTGIHGNIRFTYYESDWVVNSQISHNKVLKL